MHLIYGLDAYFIVVTCSKNSYSQLILVYLLQIFF